MTHSTRLLHARRLDTSQPAEALVTALAALGINSSVAPGKAATAVVPEGIQNLAVWCWRDRESPDDLVFEWHDDRARMAGTEHLQLVADRIAGHVRARLASTSS